jgi:hypothetical protein
MMSGIVAIALIIPVFIFSRALGERKAGMLPYITLLAGVLTVAIAYVIFWT